MNNSNIEELSLLKELEEANRILHYARKSRKITIEERDVLEEKSFERIELILKTLTKLRGVKYSLSDSLDKINFGHCYA